MTLEDRQKLTEDTEAQFSGLVFCREKRNSDVLTVLKAGRDQTFKRDKLSIDPWAYVCNSRGGIVQKTIHVTHMMALGRERRALFVCKFLLEQTALCSSMPNTPINILLRGTANGSALLKLGNSNVSAFAEMVKSKLNAKQASVFQEHEIKKVQLIHGPPGTGKTSVIDQLLRSPAADGMYLQDACDKHIVAVVSEKNMAIDAVAASLLRRGGGTVGNIVWEETVAHGVQGSLGKNATSFLIKSKVDAHPDVLEKEHALELAECVVKDAEKVFQVEVENNFPWFVDTFSACVVKKGNAAHGKPDKTVATEWQKYKAIKKKGLEHACHLWEIVQDFLPSCEKKQVIEAKDKIALAEAQLLEAKLTRDAKLNDVAKTRRKIQQQLTLSARVFLSTLGSAHGVVDLVEGDELSDDQKEPVSMTVICDEASTVQSALFIGAFCNIGAVITNIIVIGDDRQLGPYWPLHNSNSEPGSLFADAKHVTSPIFLSEQYRAPRFVVPILNAFFYTTEGLVHARPDRESDESGVLWVDVGGQGWGVYESELEAVAAVQIAERCLAQGQSVMIITPYKKQRELLQSKMEGTEWQDDELLTICTVDGAQGQEADTVIVSLVKPRPTRFLHARRMCVMLSRARSRLVLVGNHDTHMKSNSRVLEFLAGCARRVHASQIA